MGELYKKAELYLASADSNDVIVEIGSSLTGSGSTPFFNSLANQKGTTLHTIDIDDKVSSNQRLNATVTYQMSGSRWATTIFPALNKKISLLYLDNYDYDYRVGFPSWVDDQKVEYQEKYGITLNNLDCTVEHLKQMIALLPYMADHSTVICDDTYLSNGCWIGKCGAVVPYLIVNGFKIIDIECVTGSAYAVALSR